MKTHTHTRKKKSQKPKTFCNTAILVIILHWYHDFQCLSKFIIWNLYFQFYMYLLMKKTAQLFFIFSLFYFVLFSYIPRCINCFEILLYVFKKYKKKVFLVIVIWFVKVDILMTFET